MNLNFNEICRLCLRFCEEYIDLSQTNGLKTLSSELAEKIKFCYFIQIDLLDGLPTKICYQCIQVVSFFYLAKKNVVISEHLLRNVLSMRKKLQDTAVICREENMTSNFIDINQNNQKKRESVLVSHNKLNSDEDIAVLGEVELNFSEKFTDKPVSNNIPSDLKKENSVNDANEIMVVNLEKNDGFRLEEQVFLQPGNQENDLGYLLSDPNNELVLSLKFRDLKRLRNQSKKNSEMTKD